MIKQIINGKQLKTVNAKMSEADSITLSAVLAGRLSTWETTAEGGIAKTVAVPNFIRFSVGKKGLNSRKSAAITLPHVNPAKTLSDISSAVVGSWDADFLTTVKCEYCNGVGASSKGSL